MTANLGLLRPKGRTYERFWEDFDISLESERALQRKMPNFVWMTRLSQRWSVMANMSIYQILLGKLVHSRRVEMLNPLEPCHKGWGVIPSGRCCELHSSIRISGTSIWWTYAPKFPPFHRMRCVCANIASTPTTHSSLYTYQTPQTIECVKATTRGLMDDRSSKVLAVLPTN